VDTDDLEMALNQVDDDDHDDDVSDDVAPARHTLLLL